MESAQEKLVVTGDLTDEQLADAYIIVQKDIKNKESLKKNYHSEIYSRVSDRGEKFKEGNESKRIESGSRKMTLEARTAVKVNNDEAVKLFQSKGINDFEVSAEINVKSGVNAKDIPKEVMDKMNEYFDITVHKTVKKEAIEQNFKEGLINAAERQDCIEEKITYAVKVT
jgi:hypothetical protein